MSHTDIDSLSPPELRDLVRRLRSENSSLAASGQELQRRAEDTITQLLEAQKMESVGRMVSGLAHNFNNLLMGIDGCCRTVSQHLPDGSPAADLLHDVHEAVRSGMALTRELLSFSGSSVGERTHSDGPVDLNDALTRARAIIQALVGESIAVQTRIADTLATVHVQRGQAEQILMNLAANARDAMSDGGTLTIGVRVDDAGDPDPADEADATAVRQVELTVSDTGRGMDEPTRRRAFEPFFTTKGEAGTGLGLATVGAIVRRAGGSVSIDSTPGGGTTVRMQFPLAAAPPPAPVAAEPATQADVLDSAQVLLVEDDRLVRLTVRSWLEARGARVVEAATVDEALAAANSHADRFRLVLTDMVLPGGDGRMLATRLREAAPDLPVVFMSAYPREQLEAEGRLQPGERTLEKPFGEADLYRLLRSVLEATENG